MFCFKFLSKSSNERVKWLLFTNANSHAKSVFWYYVKMMKLEKVKDLWRFFISVIIVVDEWARFCCYSLNKFLTKTSNLDFGLFTAGFFDNKILFPQFCVYKKLTLKLWLLKWRWYHILGIGFVIRITVVIYWTGFWGYLQLLIRHLAESLSRIFSMEEKEKCWVHNFFVKFKCSTIDVALKFPCWKHGLRLQIWLLLLCRWLLL